MQRTFAALPNILHLRFIVKINLFQTLLLCASSVKILTEQCPLKPLFFSEILNLLLGSLLKKSKNLGLRIEELKLPPITFLDSGKKTPFPFAISCWLFV